MRNNSSIFIFDYKITPLIPLYPINILIIVKLSQNKTCVYIKNIICKKNHRNENIKTKPF